MKKIMVSMNGVGLSAADLLGCPSSEYLRQKAA
jgi:hypothetical protein